MLPAPTAELIRNQSIIEGGEYEFKSQVDLGDDRQKSNLVDDVVAFLNAGPGHIIIGVQERAGVFSGFRPLTDDPDKTCRRVLSILQDNIDPRPLRLTVRPMEVEGGFLLHLDIGEHLMRPYQNRLNGAFYLRTGPKNTPLTRAEVGAMFTSFEHYETDVLRRMSEEENRLAKRDVMQTKGATLHVGILPREHYERGRPVFHRGHGALKGAPLFHDRRSNVFVGCQSGHEAVQIDLDQRGICRTYIGNDWFVHLHVVYPFSFRHERITLPEFKTSVENFLADIGELISREAVRGPFCIALAVRNLQRDEKVAWAFPNVEEVSLPRPEMIEQISDPALVDRFYGLILSASRYG